METIKNVLWVDDDINTRALKPYVIELEENNYKVIAAETPEEAFEKLAVFKNNLAAIIIDISMPLGNSIDFTEAKAGTQTGLVVLKRIVNIADTKLIPLIVFTIVNNDQEVKQWCEENNVPYYLKRVEYPDTLLTIVNARINEGH